MASTKINTDEVHAAGSLADNARQKLATAKNGARDISDRLDGKIKQRNNIGGWLNALANALSNAESRVTRIKNVANDSAENYRRTDAQVSARARDLDV